MLNESQILVLKEYNGNLQVETIPVEDSSFIIDELNNAVKNPNKTLMDVQSMFLNNIHPINNYYPYLYPWAYSASYISGARKPIKYTFDEYEKELDEVVKQKMEGKNERSKILSSAKQEIKEAYASSCKRYIKQQALDKAFETASNNPHVKMYSRECIGWRNFEYKITDDVKVSVYTNCKHSIALEVLS